jgi:glycosyltransferase involved in cell wall biosynthesis
VFTQGLKETTLKILVTLEDHLRRGPDGGIYGFGPTGYSLWSELLDSFDEVVLLARVESSNSSRTAGNEVEGSRISVQELPDYVGPWNYLLALSTLRARVRKAVAKCDAYLLRVPGLVGRLAWQEVRRLKRNYGAEVMSDPWDTLSRGSVPGSLRPLYRRIASRNLKSICERSVATIYWSGGTMRKRYPPAPHSRTWVAPRINLFSGYASPELMLERFHRLTSTAVNECSGHLVRIGFMGSFAQLYKGADTLLRTVSVCPENGLRFETVFVGEGRYRKNSESLAKELSLEKHVKFLGQLEFGKPIVDFLDSIDLFIMPSRAEGLPRALVEAMARGCPCIGSNVGGIPELLAPEDLVPPNDPEALARKIMEVTADPDRMKTMSERNLARAKQFDPEALRNVRRSFYEYVRDHSGSNVKARREEQPHQLL